MGESLADGPEEGNKMGESMTQVGALRQSVSFGRFEHDTLSWEKWSAFPTNKYLEEVEKCSTPGSVAQKKAYFEAHYKRIAAQKAMQDEQHDQEKNKEAGIVNEEDGYQSDSVHSNCMDSLHFGQSNSQNEAMNLTSDISCANRDSVNGDERENEVNNVAAEMSCNNPSLDHGVEVENNVTHTASELRIANDDNNECEHSLPPNVDLKEESCFTLENPVTESPKECVLMKEDVLLSESQDNEGLDGDKDKGLVNAAKGNEEEVKSKILNKSRKMKTVKKTADSKSVSKKPASPVSKKPASSMPKKPASSTLRKPTSPVPRSPMVSAPELSRPSLSRTAGPTPLSSAKKDNGLNGKKTTRTDNKRAAPTSIHMSLSFGPSNPSSASLPTTRKSMIMETMGDKDIVRRAFKAFQNSFNQQSPSSVDKPSANHPLLGKAETTGSVSDSPKKKNEGNLKAVKKASSQTGGQGLRKTSLPSGSPKIHSSEQRNVRTLSSSFRPRNQDRLDQQKAVTKRLEERSTAKDAVRTHHLSRVKVEKDNSRAKRIPGFNHGSSLSKSCLSLRNMPKEKTFG